MYLVTWEYQHDGMWCSDPEAFDTEREAEECAKKSLDALLPGNCIAIYRCDLLRTFDPVGGLGK